MSETEAPLLAFPGGTLPGIRQSLFVQAPLSDAPDVMPILEKTGVGVTYTLNPAFSEATRNRRTAQVVAQTISSFPAASILLDANRYKGKKRKDPRDGFDQKWLDHQHAMGLPWALTDSGYAPDLQGVRTLLANGAGVEGQTVIVLPMPGRLLGKEAAKIQSTIENQPHPVALVLEDSYDPCDQPGVIEGLVRLFQGAQQVGLLRSDAAALGGLLHGARFGAVGVRSGQRHLYKPGGRSPQRDVDAPPPMHIYIPSLMTFVSREKFSLAYLIAPDLPAWTCDCDFCAGQSLSRLLLPGTPHSHSADHTMGALSALGQDIMAHSPAIPPEVHWRNLSMLAQVTQMTLAGIGDGQKWEARDALGGWVRAGAQLVP